MLRLARLKAGSHRRGQLSSSERGTPQGGLGFAHASNILLTPFDREMRLRGYQLTSFADDRVTSCKSAAEARAAVEAARRILKQLGFKLHPQKPRITRNVYGQFGRRTEASTQARLLRPDSFRPGLTAHRGTEGTPGWMGASRKSAEVSVALTYLLDSVPHLVGDTRQACRDQPPTSAQFYQGHR
ncbi:MAG TPA: reverse transcriptase domain-containing protein [Verrucomicrobiae bacterium]|nr:reverse transcriptase domain-containing protein [Verrucomicrobiae bacterium]